MVRRPDKSSKKTRPAVKSVTSVFSDSVQCNEGTHERKSELKKLLAEPFKLKSFIMIIIKWSS